MLSTENIGIWLTACRNILDRDTPPEVNNLPYSSFGSMVKNVEINGRRDSWTFFFRSSFFVVTRMSSIFIHSCLGEKHRRPRWSRRNGLVEVQEVGCQDSWEILRKVYLSILIFFKEFSSRYGAPGQVESMYSDFATHFLNHLGIPCVETMLKLLDNKRNGIYVSNRVRNVFFNWRNKTCFESCCKEKSLNWFILWYESCENLNFSSLLYRFSSTYLVEILLSFKLKIKR